MNSNPPDSLSRAAGIALVTGAALAVFFMWHHPSTGSHELASALEELRDEGALSSWVHGLLIGVMVGVWFGTYGLTRRLGSDRCLPILAFLFFGLGILAYCLAAMVSGFIVPEIASRYAGATPAEMQQALGLLRISTISNQAFANAGLVGSSLGIFAWSMALLTNKPGHRWAGIAGVLIGLLPAVMMVTGNLTLNVVGMTWVIVAQSAWYVIIGVTLLRNRI